MRQRTEEQKNYVNNVDCYVDIKPIYVSLRVEQVSKDAKLHLLSSSLKPNVTLYQQQLRKLIAVKQLNRFVVM